MVCWTALFCCLTSKISYDAHYLNKILISFSSLLFNQHIREKIVTFISNGRCFIEFECINSNFMRFQELKILCVMVALQSDIFLQEFSRFLRVLGCYPVDKV